MQFSSLSLYKSLRFSSLCLMFLSRASIILVASFLLASPNAMGGGAAPSPQPPSNFFDHHISVSILDPLIQLSTFTVYTSRLLLTSLCLSLYMFLTIEACILCLFVGAVVPCHSFMYLQSLWCRVGKKQIIHRCCTLLKKDSCMAEAATVFEIDPIFVFEIDPIFVFQNDPPGWVKPVSTNSLAQDARMVANTCNASMSVSALEELCLTI